MSDSEDDFDDDPSLDEEPIHRAAREGDLAALRRELDAGYSPDCLCTVDNITPLQILCMKRQDGGCQASNDIRLQGVKILLAAGATDTKSSRSRASRTKWSRTSSRSGPT